MIGFVLKYSKKEVKIMSMTTEEMRLLRSMLDACQEKFGDVSPHSVVCASGCDACTGGCEGHGASIWSTCDVK